MVNASLNWTSILGIILFASSGILFVFKKSRNQKINVSIKVLIILNLIAGFILFLQGWRLDPILQFMVFIIIFGTFLELVPFIYLDFKKKNRKEIIETKEVSIVEPVNRGDSE